VGPQVCAGIVCGINPVCWVLCDACPPGQTCNPDTLVCEGTAADADADADADSSAEALAEAEAEAEADGADEGGGGCEYPPGPYGFFAEGDTVPQMAWPSSITGPDETVPADLSRIRCQPGVHTIFFQIVATYCPVCPTRMREIASLKDTWERYGAKWVFFVGDIRGASLADAYVNRYGITFGWRTDDHDNTAGNGAVAGSSLVGGQIPWTAVVRASDMQFIEYERAPGTMDIVGLAARLASE
jgi:hypothetical protein